jgi:hypothetical protein
MVILCFTYYVYHIAFDSILYINVSETKYKIITAASFIDKFKYAISGNIRTTTKTCS